MLGKVQSAVMAEPAPLDAAATASLILGRIPVTGAASLVEGGEGRGSYPARSNTGRIP
jgi:hypothetical protein